MIPVTQRYITDSNGKRVGVILDIEEYDRILAELEEQDDVRAYDEAKANAGEMIPLEQAVSEIESGKT